MFPLPEIHIPELKDHIVIIGKDSRALSLSKMAKSMNLRYVSIVFDPATARKRQQKGETVIYGDAVNDPILMKAHVNKAKIIVVSVGNLITLRLILQHIRKMNNKAYVLVRTKHVEDIEELYRLGASQVIPEEFETAIELFERVLAGVHTPRKDINKIIGDIRDHHYGIFQDTEEQPVKAPGKETGHN